MKSNGDRSANRSASRSRRLLSKATGHDSAASSRRPISQFGRKVLARPQRHSFLSRSLFRPCSIRRHGPGMIRHRTPHGLTPTTLSCEARTGGVKTDALALPDIVVRIVEREGGLSLGECSDCGERVSSFAAAKRIPIASDNSNCFTRGDQGEAAGRAHLTLGAGCDRERGCTVHAGVGRLRIRTRPGILQNGDRASRGPGMRALQRRARGEVRCLMVGQPCAVRASREDPAVGLLSLIADLASAAMLVALVVLVVIGRPHAAFGQITGVCRCRSVWFRVRVLHDGLESESCPGWLGLSWPVGRWSAMDRTRS